MGNGTSRRDFLNGTQVAIGASLLSPWTTLFGSVQPHFSLGSDYYPPALTGIRGNRDGTWESMHARVACHSCKPGKPEENFDLVLIEPTKVYFGSVRKSHI